MSVSFFNILTGLKSYPSKMLSGSFQLSICFSCTFIQEFFLRGLVNMIFVSFL